MIPLSQESCKDRACHDEVRRIVEAIRVGRASEVGRGIAPYREDYLAGTESREEGR